MTFVKQLGYKFCK